MKIDLDDFDNAVYKISATFRCGGGNGEKQGCDHKTCEAVFLYMKSIQEWIKNQRKCPTCNGSGQRHF